jgi:Radical SAM superfamily/4Fe-4S single cluster domain
MPLTFNALVLIPSDHCNLSCRHCAPACGPKLKHRWDATLLRTCISDAAKIPNLNKVVHFAGGEPLLYQRELLELCQHAHQNGFASTMVTNGFWGRNSDRSREYFKQLSHFGLVRVELSTDVFHQEFLPIEVIGQAIGVLKGVGLRITLRVITTRAHSIDETLGRLSPEDLDGLEIIGSPVVPIGRAREAVPQSEYYLSDRGSVGACHQSLNLTVRSDGSVFPCCAGSEENPSLSIGNINALPIDLLVRRAELNMTLKQLVYSGPSSFFELLREEGLGHKIKCKYTNICHVCSEMFSDREVVDVISRHMLSYQSSIVAESLSGVLAGGS